MAQGSNKTVWIFLVWSLVFLTSCGIAFAAWKTLGTLAIDVFPLGNDIAALAAQVDAMQAHYATTANALKEQVEVWGLAALVLGVSGGVASVLRAPQAVIVGLGGFAAVIFGATQIYDPQNAVKALNTARNQLACVKPRVLTLTQLRQRTEPFVRSAQDSASDAVLPLLNSSAALGAGVAQLAATRVAHPERRAHARDAIDAALLVPFMSTDTDWDRLVEHRNHLFGLRMAVEDHVHASASDALTDALSRLDERDHLLAEAQDALSRPADLEFELGNTLNAYDHAMQRSAALLAEGDALARQSTTMATRLGENVDQLSRWPAEFEAALTAAHTATNRIQNTVHAELASGGVADTPISEIVASATDLHLGDALADLDINNADILAAPDVLARPPSVAPLPTDARLLIVEVDAALAVADAALASLDDTLARARQRSAALNTLRTEQQPVLVGAEQRLQRDSVALDGASQLTREDMATGTRAIEEAGTILNLPAPARLETEIKACLETA
ncbi:MAG: hypothetical protein AAF460_18365 [Pseudomonadota bacterium]